MPVAPPVTNTTWPANRSEANGDAGASLMGRILAERSRSPLLRGQSLLAITSSWWICGGFASSSSACSISAFAISPLRWA